MQNTGLETGLRFKAKGEKDPNIVYILPHENDER